MKKTPDIFIGQTDARGIVYILQRREHNGFPFYSHHRIRVKVQPVSEEHTERLPRGIRESRQARREYIAMREAEGLVVKGVQYISKDLINQYNTGRFEVVTILKDMLDVARVWQKDKGFIMMGAFDELYTRVHDTKTFGDVSYGSIKNALHEGSIFEVKPKDDAEEI